MTQLSVGVDIGRHHHHIAAIDDTGQSVFSERVANNEKSITAAIAKINKRDGITRWALDMNSGPAALLIAVLRRHNITACYVPANRAADMAKAINGERKTDARDAHSIAELLRVRPDQTAITDDTSQIQLRILTRHRHDIVEERVRTIMRMQAILVAISPPLNDILDLTNLGPAYVLTRWQTPDMIRQAGVRTIREHLHDHHIPNAKSLATKIVATAKTQTIRTHGETTYAPVVQHLADKLLTLTAEIRVAERQIADITATNPTAAILMTMTGIGSVLAAELIAIAGDFSSYPNSNQLAAHAGLAPVERESGRITDNKKRPKRYHRDLRRVFTQSSLTALKHCRISRAYYDKKRAEGRSHRQALTALSRHRLRVLWTMVNTGQPFTATTTKTAAAKPATASTIGVTERRPRSRTHAAAQRASRAVVHPTSHNAAGAAPRIPQPKPTSSRLTETNDKNYDALVRHMPDMMMNIWPNPRPGETKSYSVDIERGHNGRIRATTTPLN